MAYEEQIQDEADELARPFEAGARGDICAAQAGDQAAFGRLVKDCEGRLLIHLRRFSPNDTVLEDLLQETYLEAYLSLSSFLHRGSLINWLRSIATRVGYRYWDHQTRDRRAKAAYAQWIRNGSCERPPQLHYDDEECVEAFLSCLDQTDRRIVELKYLKDLKAADIARRMGWDAVRVRVRAHRALKKLRQAHRDDGGIV